MTLEIDDNKMNKRRAYLYALRLLAQRDYSRDKLLNKLKLKKFSDKIITDVINDLLQSNYLNEENYINSKIRSLIYKNHSIESIKFLLQSEGLQIDLSIIQNVFTDLNFSEEQQIYKLLEKKLPLKMPTTFKEIYKVKNRAIQYALSKGHKYSDIIPILSKIIDTKIC